MSELTLWLPKPPDNANGRDHWAVANRKKKRFWAELDVRAAVQHLGFPRPPEQPIERALLFAEWFASRHQWAPDKDNITRRLKPAVDWLVANHYLVGDTPDRVSWADHVVHVGEKHPVFCTVRLSISIVDGI